MRVLVSTASKHGSTAEIGARIGGVIEARGHRVDVLRPEDVDDVVPYDVVVLGSAVYAGRWQKEARQLVEREGGVLVQRPVWLFSSGPIGDPPKPDEDPVDIADVMAATKAEDHRVFAGRLDRRSLSFPERAIVAALHVADGDDRDWDAIDAWATSIADAISTG